MCHLYFTLPAELARDVRPAVGARLGDERSVALAATFEVADDLLWQARAGRLAARGAINVGRSGQIGPLVELALAIQADPVAYVSVTITPPFFQQVQQGIAGHISGFEEGAFGVISHQVGSR